MKNIIFLLLIFLILIFFNCNILESEPDHSIRIKNNSKENFLNVKVGSVDFGTINSGSTTEYKSIDTGSHAISWSTPTGGGCTGTVSLSGEGEHLWTITIGDGCDDYSITED